MRIFFCETFDDGTVGGSHACMYNLIRNLDRKTFHCTVGFYGDNMYVGKYRELGIEVNVLPIGKPIVTGNRIIRKIRNWYNLEHKAGMFLERFLREKKFDLIVLNNSIFVSLLFVRSCRKLAVPLVIYERGIDFLLPKHVRASVHVQASIPISNAVMEFLTRYGIRTKIVEMIYDGIDPAAAVQRTSGMMKAGLGLPPESRIIGIVGNLRPWKGQRYFVEAFVTLARQHPDLYGLVVGGWSEEDKGYRDELAGIVSQAGLAERILFLGYRKDVPEILSAMDVFVHASIKPEPFGMVLLEAMAARTPVIATDMGGPVEILDNGGCGALVPPKDARAIANAANRYLADRQFRENTVDLAWKRLNEHFHIRETVRMTESLFKRVVDNGGAGRS
jgi:L-malate glycosyltransferase